MTEEWRDVVGYEGLYEVSNMGRVKSVERTVWNSVRGYYKTVHERILKAKKNNYGYLQVQLCRDGKAKQYLVHRLVATAFCENQMGYTEVNHIDEDKTNNCADNLEFCDRVYNCNYGTRNEKSAEKQRNDPNKSKPVFGINKVSGLILEFPSTQEASRQLRISQGHIWGCCKGKRKSAGGFYWHYVDDKEVANE